MFAHIVAFQSTDRGIGKDGNLLIRSKEDMDFFRKQTAGSIVLMGRNTAESIPNNGCLEGRTSVVISTTRSDLGHHTFPTVEEGVQFCKEQNRITYVIGGESIYEATFEYCTSIFATVYHGDHVEGADTFYPEIPDRFTLIGTRGLNVQFTEYLDIEKLTNCITHDV